MSRELNLEALLKSLGVIFIGILALSLVYNLFFQMGPTTMGNQGMMGHGGMATPGVGFSLSGLLAGILMIVIKLLSILLVIGLVVGIGAVLKDYLFQGGGLSWLSPQPAAICCSCGQNVKGGYDYCPHCGASQKRPAEKA